MGRRTIIQILQEANIDVSREYERLFELFFKRRYPYSYGRDYTLHDHCAENFMSIPIRGTCVSLSDFENTYGFKFQDNTHIRVPPDRKLDLLLCLCEFTYNIAFYSQQLITKVKFKVVSAEPYQPIIDYLMQVQMIIDKIGYMANSFNGITEYVPKDQSVLAVAGVLDATLSYKLIDYSHHSMRGDLKRKRETLLLLADKLEAEEKKLKQINSTLADDLFFMLNNLNIRHNNTEEGGKNYKAFVASLAPEELEKWYDEVYHVCLLAFMELEHSPRKRAIAELKKNINNAK